jgi:rhodanese-related sulfurtransferase
MNCRKGSAAEQHRPAERTFRLDTDHSTEDLRRRMHLVTLVEALGASYFENAHIPGAVNIPPHRVLELAPVLLPDKEARIIVYCEHRHSPNADIVIRQLARMGYRNLSRYGDGKEAWIRAGLPVEGGPD